MNEEQLMEEESTSAIEARRREIEQKFDPNNVKVIRKELFANLRDPAVIIRDGNISFNTACINSLEGVVYVNVMFDEELAYLAITPCDENDKEAIRWCVARQDKRKTRRLSCREFTDMVYKLMEWDKKCRYKVLGFRVTHGDEVYFVFDLNVKKVYKEKPKKGEEDEESVTINTRAGFYSDDVASTFAVPMEQYKKETEVKEKDGFVQISMLTGVREE